jgi:hypothetical protein
MYIVPIYMEISQRNSLCSYLEQTKMSLFFIYKVEKQEGGTGTAWMKGWYQREVGEGGERS